MKLLACLILLSVSALSAFDKLWPMEDKKPIEIDRGFLATKFSQDGHRLKGPSMNEVLGRYPESKRELAASKAWLIPGVVFAGGGGFLMGYSAFGPEFNGPMFLAGLGSVAVALGIGRISEGKLVRAVEAYNALQGKADLDWRLSPGGAALRLSYRFGG